MLANIQTSKQQFLAGGSELSGIISAKDWSATPLGPIEDWPQSLKTSVNLILNSQHPMWIGWGPEATFLYNDAYIQVLSLAKHPWALGRPAFEVWAEIWDVCGPLAEMVFKEGKATYADDVQLFMNRGTFIEETYYSFSYSPIYDEAGKVAGLFCPSAETTAKVLHTRRLKTLSELASNALIEKTTRAACASAFETLRKNSDDIPFALLYLVDNEKRMAQLEQYASIPGDASDLLPARVFLTESGRSADVPWPIEEVVRSKRPIVIEPDRADDLPFGCAGNRVSQAIALPVTLSGGDAPIGVLVAGINPCRNLDTDYQTFYDLLANQIAMAIQNARGAEEERRRVEMLAEIDRAKTVFFGNVSHEFRTPLTLMLGPLEDIINNSAQLLPRRDQEALQSTHRNAMRLLRLVNTLLDFSKIEAGRLTANFVPVDLTTFTADLAGNFRSVIEHAGLKFFVECGEISGDVYVDHQMWEKILFNLLSNAFKYTLQGHVSVSLSQEGEMAVLRVSDTGIGIPEDEVPRMFERFHRVRNATGRTFEGTGIGLSLVKELVSLHSGGIEVESREGVGTTFIVSIPLGKGHLPSSRIAHEPLLLNGSSLSHVYVKELESLMGNAPSADPQPEDFQGGKGRQTDPSAKTRVLVVDDNADMRQYISRMLSNRYDVEGAENGQVALETVRTWKPDIILSDIMMPVMDGIQFLRSLKNDSAFSRIPVILLSARAGEEARIEGYELGADDYLVKPFSANELLARVKAQISIARIRHHAETHLKNLFLQAPVTIVVFRGPRFIIEIANEKLLQYWGKELDDILHKPLLEVLPDIAGTGLIERLSDVLNKGTRYVEHEREVPLHRNGRMETTYVSYVYEPLRNDEGEITHVMVLANEVTDSVMARKKIEASESKFRNLVLQAPVGIAIVRRPDFLVEIANDSYLQLVGRKADELVGKAVFDVLPEVRRSGLAGILEHVLESGEPYFGSEFPVSLRRNGQEELAYFNFVYQPLVEENKVEGVICVVVEVTDSVKARKIVQDLAVQLEERVQERTKELQVSNAMLEASNRELEQFAFIASHDLQEPLRKIQTFSELLRKHISDRGMVEKYVDKIDLSAARMAVLIRDVLDYSRVSRIEESFQPVDLNQLLENVKADFELRIAETNAELRNDKLPVIRGVALQLHQLFFNLIGNSLKFSKANPVITITSRQLPAEEVALVPGLQADKSYIKITFADNGIGFEQKYAEKIFVIFQRLNYEGKQTGTGIGLALSKKIVENHGGVIIAHGELNKGATFDVYLPA